MDALKAMLPKYEGRVKRLYIDPRGLSLFAGEFSSGTVSFSIVRREYAGMLFENAAKGRAVAETGGIAGFRNGTALTEKVARFAKAKAAIKDVFDSIARLGTLAIQ